jgi:alkylation response protein AidB-like acyl-CoA dehydrogenase
MTMFFVDMASPGITVRPIRQLSGISHFNEVFFDDVFVPDDQRLGEVGGGWQVALTTLSNERMTLGASTPLGFDELFELVRKPAGAGSAPIDSPGVRERLAEWYAKVTGLRYGVYRILASLERGERPGPEVAVGKLVGARTTQDIAAFGLDLLGARGHPPHRGRHRRGSAQHPGRAGTGLATGAEGRPRTVPQSALCTADLRTRQ